MPSLSEIPVFEGKRGRMQRGHSGRGDQ
jgi:hypothetical protein